MATVEILWITAGLSCDGDSVSITAATQPSIEDILLGMRRGLDLYINLRPVRLLHERLTPLVNRKPSEIDFVVFRENTEGAYCAAGGFLKHGTADEIAHAFGK